jgi:hypothetical protein
VIPGLALVYAPPTGYAEKPPPLAPDPITSIVAESDRVRWTYAEPEDFTGYLVRTTLTAGQSWSVATPLKTTSSLFVLNSELPALTAEVLVKPTRFGFEAIHEARVVPLLGGGGDPGGGGGGGTGTSATFPFGPWTRVAPYASRTNKTVVGAAGFQAAINSASPGDCIVLDANATPGTLTVGCKGTAAKPIIICSDKDLGDETQYRQLSGGGKVIFSGAEYVIWRGFTHNNVRVQLFKAKNCQVECVRATGHTTTSSENAWLGVGDSGAVVTNNLVGFIHYVNNTAPFFDYSPALSEARKLLFTHCFTENRSGDGARVGFPGRNPGDGIVDTESIFQYGLDKGANTTTDYCELKFNGFHFKHCTIHMSQTSGGEAQQTKVRHGRLDPGSTDIKVARGNIFEGLLYIQDGSGAAPSITIRGMGHKVFNCWVLKLGPNDIPSLSSTAGNGRINPLVGHRDPFIFPQGQEPSGQNCRFVGAGKLVIAGNRNFTVSEETMGGENADPCPGAEDWIRNGHHPKQCWIPTSGKTRNTAFNAGGFKDTNTTAWPDGTAWPDANIDKVPLRLFEEDVGPDAWDRTFVLDDDGGGGDPGGGGPTDGDIAIGNDYTVNWGAQLGTGGGTPPPPPPPPPDFDSMVPEANLAQYVWGAYPTLNTAKPATPSTLQGILNNAVAGDEIVLANGSYGTAYTAPKSGSASKPIVIRAANKHLAVFGAGGSLAVSGAWVSVDGIKFQSTPINKIKMNADHIRVTRCEFTEQPWENEQKCITFGGNWAHIDRNEFHHLECGLVRWNDDGLDAWVEHNHAHHIRSTTVANDPSLNGVEHNELFQFGQSNGDHPKEVRAVFEKNLIEHIGAGVDAELVSVKSSRSKYYKNTFRNSGETNYNVACRLQNRGGENNTYVANTLIGHDLRLCGRGQVAYSNAISGAGGGLYLNAGTIVVPPGGSPGSNAMAVLIDAKLADNHVQKITLAGTAFGPATTGPKDTVFSNNQPNYIGATAVHDKSQMNVSSLDNGTSIFNQNTSYTLVTPAALSASDVGPDFPEPE